MKSRLPKAEAIELILQDNNLLKRTLLQCGGRVVIGFDEAAYRALKG